MKKYVSPILTAPFLAALLLSFSALLPSCKKSSGGSDNGSSSPYYLSATINGKAWNANVANDSLHSPVLAVLTGSGSSTIALAIGIQASGKDSSALAIVFPKNITLNKTLVFNASNYMAAVYVANPTNTYETSKNTNSDDSLTITSFDQNAKIIEGTFKGTFYLTTGTGSVKITDGKFKTPYLTDASQLPPNNIKF